MVSLPSQSAWLQGLAAAVPSRCAVCGAWPARPVCDACIARFGAPRTRCLRCALPLAAGQPVCGACLTQPPPLATCHAAVDYAYPWSGLLARFKFQGEPGWAGPLAALMRAAPDLADAIAQADAVVPLPLAPARLAERGFNQALELARRLAPDRTRTQWLVRLRETPAQARLDLAARAANVRGAFAVEPLRHADVRGLRVLLVDDVMTSGASLHAAALALQAAGALSVSAAVFARTPDPPGGD
ncbi:phosphoribosyltransferase family protein [Ramlibacter sp.]|uniref:phosphoribosyltransferase family protein n=1 Tax=Ramlibacter sp. TaxID=1917967 RepID=UPI0035B2A44D